MLTCPQNRWSHVDLPTEQVESCRLAHRTGGSYVDLPTEQVKLNEQVESC